MRKPILTIFIFLSIFVSYYPTACIAQYCMPSWKYEVPITITNNTFANLTDYQVKLTVNTSALISNGKMSSSGDDIRFTDTINCKSIPYWIESGINTSSTIIWIKLPLLKASSSTVIRMLYGNSSASAASNGDSIFILFDDFNGSTLNSSKWNTYGSSNSGYSISGGLISVTAGTISTNTVGTRVFVSKSSYTSPIVAEGLIASTTGYYTSLGLLNSGSWEGYSLSYGDNTANTNEGMHIGIDYSDDADYASNFQTTETNPGTLKGIWQVSWPTSNTQIGTWPGGSSNANLTGITMGSSVQLTFGNIFTTIGTSSYDWVRARAYAPSEPTFQVGNEKLNHTSGFETSKNNIGFSVYPNPASDNILINLADNNIEIKAINILNISGKIVFSLYAQPGSVSYHIPVENLSKGIYIIQLKGENGIYMGKFVKD